MYDVNVGLGNINQGWTNSTHLNMMDFLQLENNLLILKKTYRFPWII